MLIKLSSGVLFYCHEWQRNEYILTFKSWNLQIIDILAWTMTDMTYQYSW